MSTEGKLSEQLSDNSLGMSKNLFTHSMTKPIIFIIIDLIGSRVKLSQCSITFKMFE